ncbi:MAG: hypothetical protein AAGA60_07030 [Cyanobacteria bacterium P01_E01_bin.42]
MSQGTHGAPNGIECPKCSRPTIISINQNLWKCLNCDFSKDFSEEEEEENNTGVFIAFGGVVIAVLCLLGL